MIHPPVTEMLLFVEVVRERSFTRAAAKLGVTKQTVSERVRKLEDRLGVRLLERTTRRLRMTEVGATYYDRCAAIAARVDEANSEVQQLQEIPMGRLRVSAPMLYGRRYLAPVVTSLVQRHAELRVELVLADRRVDLIEEGFDLAIRVGALDDSSLTARKLGEADVYYVASPAFLGRRGVRRLADLRTTPCVGLRPTEVWEHAGGRQRLEPMLVVNDLEVACEAAIAGVGVAQLPAIVCRAAVADGRLRVLFGPAPALRVPLHAVYPSRQHLSAKMRLFLDALTALTPLFSLERPPRRLSRSSAPTTHRGPA